jgi:hypothetical protein
MHNPIQTAFRIKLPILKTKTATRAQALGDRELETVITGYGAAAFSR